MTSNAMAKRRGASASRSEEISSETLTSWSASIADAMRTVLYGNSDPEGFRSRNRLDAAGPEDMHRLKQLETEAAHLTNLATIPVGSTRYFPLALKAALNALTTPLAAEGAAIISLDDRGGTPIMLCETENAPSSALLGATDLLLAGSHAPSHGICVDDHPILAGPWQMPSGQRAVLVFWRRQGAKSWKKRDHALVLMAAALSASLRHAVPPSKETMWRDVTDTLTGLPNAGQFAVDLPRHFARLDRDDLPGTLMLVSVDGFSRLNALLGRKSANEVLRQTAGFLIRATRATDVIARTGGNEFAIWFNGIDHFTAAERAEQVTVDAPRALPIAAQEQGTPPISVSVSIAMRRPSSTETVSDLMRRAKHAMHEARKAGPGCWRTSQKDNVTAWPQTSRSRLFAAQPLQVS
jgi:diguanylate cyclase (GGDEF)-like protein